MKRKKSGNDSLIGSPLYRAALPVVETRRRFPALRAWGFRRRGLIGGAFLLPALLVSLFSKPIIKEGTWAHFLVDSFAWIAFLGGLLFRLWPTLYIGGRKRTTLVCEGPYSICRNPLYLGSLLLAVSFGFFLESFVFGVFLGAVIWVYLSRTIPAEERDLTAILGQPYTEYCKRVPRLLPKFSLFSTPGEIAVRVKGLRLEAKRASLWVLLPIFGELVANLRNQSWWPHWFNLY